jgi:hypothetical protein
MKGASHAAEETRLVLRYAGRWNGGETAGNRQLREPLTSDPHIQAFPLYEPTD